MMNSLNKMDTTTLPVKRLFDNNNSLDISNKKSKVSLIDDQGKDEDDIPSSNINKRPYKSDYNLFSSLRKELGLVKLSFEECNRNPKVEERRLRSIKRDIEKCCKELENKETQVKEFESEKTNFESQQKVFELKEKEYQEKEKEFQSKEKVFEAKEKTFEGKMKEFLSKEEKFLSKEKVFEAKEEDLELTKKQYDEEKEFDKSNMDDQLCDTIDGTIVESEILDDLRESSDPAKIILDIIVNPITPLPKKGDKAVIIDESRIYLLVQLMRISPNIKSCVREEALKLAHELKNNMKENTENSLEVLGFLLILSIYGLLTYFDEDEVLKLFESVAEHKIAVMLSKTLGLSN